MSATSIAIPKAKFQFDSKEKCEVALEALNTSHPNLIANIVASTKDTSKFYLFVQSLHSTIFDLSVRNLIEKAGGTFVKMVK